MSDVGTHIPQSGASLTRGSYTGEGGRADDHFEVGVLVHDQCVVAAQLEKVFAKATLNVEVFKECRNLQLYSDLFWFFSSF